MKIARNVESKKVVISGNGKIILGRNGGCIATRRGVSIKQAMARRPINGWVGLLQPVMSEVNGLPLTRGDAKLERCYMITNSKMDGGNVGDGSARAVNEVKRNCEW